MCVKNVCKRKLPDENPRQSSPTTPTSSPFLSLLINPYISLMNKLITTIKLASGPKAIGPYSVGKIFNGLAYLSGQIGFNPETNQLASDSVEDQTHQILKNVAGILGEAGSSLEHIVKCTVYLTDMADFQKVNAVYAGYFKEDPPARVCIAVKELPAKAKVEIEVIAAVASSKL